MIYNKVILYNNCLQDIKEAYQTETISIKGI